MTPGKYLTLQQITALAALFFLPLSALNFGNSFTIGDLLLIISTILNFPRLLVLHRWQLGFLFIFPLVLASAALDRQGDLTSTIQATYLWGFVIPFGWVAFTDLLPRQIASSLVASASLSSLVAIGQSFGIVSEIGKQNIVTYYQIDFHRAAGLNILCNSLVSVLASAITLLPLIRSHQFRFIALLSIALGLMATVSKSTIFALPAFIYYIFNEPRRKQVLTTTVILASSILVASGQSSLIQEKISGFQAAIDHRATHTSDSLSMRGELISIAMSEIPNCLFIGHGPREAQQRISRPTNSGSTVHLYYLGLAITYGMTFTMGFSIGIFFLITRLYSQGNHICVAFLCIHCIALLVETVLMFSFQLLPIVVVVHLALGMSKNIGSELGDDKSNVQCANQLRFNKSPYVLTPGNI